MQHNCIRETNLICLYKINEGCQDRLFFDFRGRSKGHEQSITNLSFAFLV